MRKAEVVMPLPAGFSLRRPTRDDVEELTELARAVEIAQVGEPDTTRDDTRSHLETIDLAEDAWILETIEAPVATGGTDNLIVAYAYVYSNGVGKFSGNVTVRSDYERCGLGTYLKSLIETRASQRILEVPADARITLNGSILHGNAGALDFVQNAGMSLVRSFWRMQIDMTDPPPAPNWPGGLGTPRLFIAGCDERAVYEADDEAFADHWGHSQRPFEEWLQWSVLRADFDPSLWFLAMDGDQIAGAALCWAVPDLGDTGLGWVGQLWVRRPWRKRGLGLALLQHAFGEFYQRGYRRIVLGVDSTSLTGATRLYERAGMRVVQQWDTYQRELRPGIEYTTSALAEE